MLSYLNDLLIHIPFRRTAYRQCQPDDHLCPNNGSQICIPIAKKCDGKWFFVQIYLDESNKSLTILILLLFNLNLLWFRISNHQSIFQIQGYIDCRDESDEKDCSHSKFLLSFHHYDRDYKYSLRLIFYSLFFLIMIELLYKLSSQMGHHVN